MSAGAATIVGPATPAAWPAADPERVKAANQPAHMPRMIAGLSDEELAKHHNAELLAVRAVAQESGIKLAFDGLPPGPVDFGPGAASWQETGARAVNAGALRVLAIREEHHRRSQRALQREQGKVDEARKLLEQVHADGPAAIGELVTRARETVAAIERVAALVRDLELLSEAPRIGEVHRRYAEAVAEAAAALGKERPVLPSLPDVDVAAAQRLVRVLCTPAGGELLHTPALPSISTHKVSEAAATLRNGEPERW